MSNVQNDYILLDSSGSMETIWRKALEAVDGYVETLHNEKCDTSIQFAIFAPANPRDYGDPGRVRRTDVMRKHISSYNWQPLVHGIPSPGGGTPLNDAIMDTLDDAEKCNHNNITIVIMTDGEENASKTHSQTVRLRLDEKRALGWQIIFLGANFDNKKQSSMYGVDTTSALSADTEYLHDATVLVAKKRAASSKGDKPIAISQEEKRLLLK